MVWVLLSVCSIFLITSFDHCTRPQHQETTRFHINTTDNSFAFGLHVCNATWNLSINYRVTILTLCWPLGGFKLLNLPRIYPRLVELPKKKNNTLVRAMMCHQPAKLNLIFRHRGYYMAARRFHKWAQWTSEIFCNTRREISYLQGVMQCSICYIDTNEIPKHFTLITVFRKRGDLFVFFVTLATVIFSPVKISGFRAKAQLVFHCCLYNRLISFLSKINSPTNNSNDQQFSHEQQKWCYTVDSCNPVDERKSSVCREHTT